MTDGAGIQGPGREGGTSVRPLHVDASGSVAPARGGPPAVVITGEDWLDAICPLLRARDGSWRSASPAREHRCWATDPPSELQVLTQQRLCLVRAHDGCERFLHARELRSTSLAAERPAGAFRPSGRPRAPIRRSDGIQEAVADRFAGGLAWFRGRSRNVRVALFGGTVMVLAMVVLLLGGMVDGPRPESAASSPAPSGSSGLDTSTPGADGFRRYRVRDGDTLRTIADHFGVSVRQLRAANELGDPPQLQVGDVIFVPPAD